jgi:hypothetical protein
MIIDISIICLAGPVKQENYKGNAGKLERFTIVEQDETSPASHNKGKFLLKQLALFDDNNSKIKYSQGGGKVCG